MSGGEGWPWMKGATIAAAAAAAPAPATVGGVAASKSSVLASGTTTSSSHGTSDVDKDEDNDDVVFLDCIEETEEGETTKQVQTTTTTKEEDMNDEDDEVEEQLEEHDTRPYVKNLIQEHRNTIEELKYRVSRTCNLYDPTKHDDLWLLRFLLSHKDHVDRAFDAVQTTLQYRSDHNLDARDVRYRPPPFNACMITNTTTTTTRMATTHEQGGDDDCPTLSSEDDHNGNINSNNNTFYSCLGMDGIHVVVPDGKKYGTIFYFNIGSIDTHKLSTVSDDDWIEGMSQINEFSFQWLDYITRTTGRLTKAIHIVDVSQLGFSMYNMKTQTKYTTTAKKLQDCYPQAVKAYMVCNAPYWIETPYRALKPLLPTRVVSKLDFINPQLYVEDKQLLLKYVPQPQLPIKFGGSYAGNWPPPSIVTTTTTTTVVDQQQKSSTPPSSTSQE